MFGGSELKEEINAPELSEAIEELLNSDLREAFEKSATKADRDRHRSSGPTPPAALEKFLAIHAGAVFELIVCL